ncbi:MAG: hypothetical protein GDA65_19470 [Nitrospira sp. CR1.1]|nr:hypothetical protein [Nitrospira sp. CR1.1]
MDPTTNESDHVPLEAHSEWSAHARHYEELEKAQSRIGRTPLKTMQWAMGLQAITEERLASLSKGDFENLSYELALFSILGTRRLQRIKAGKTILMDGTWGGANWGDKKSFGESIPNSREVRNLLVELTRLIENVLTYKKADITLDQTKIVIWVGKDCGGLITLYGRIQDRFKFHIAQLLADFGSRLKRCAADDCSKSFVSVREKQLYCSKKCESRITTRRLRHAQAGIEKQIPAPQPKLNNKHHRTSLPDNVANKKGASHGQTRR